VSTERADIRGFILGRFPNAGIADDEDIFERGYVNSLFAMELVLFVEKHFGIAIPNDELSIESFRTIDAISDLVDRLSVTV
jgi:methoxymalonate biosynthesis acyl carrier protein